jgi:hypothetical protein
MSARSKRRSADPSRRDMGAYYTWINLMRLNGVSFARFLAWFEGQREAIAIVPGLAKVTVSSQNCDQATILRWMS